MIVNNRISTKQKGDEGESLAAAYLKKKGCRILDCNFRVKTGEIDIVAERKKTIIFVEVKMMTGDSALHEKINVQKQRRLIRTAQWYLASHKFEDRPWQIDVVAIYPNSSITHIEQAVEACS